MATQEALIARIDALALKEAAQAEQLTKIRGEIQKLKDAVNSGNLDKIEEAVGRLETASAASQAATQAADDENPDAPTP